MDNKILAIAAIGFVVGVFIESFLGFGLAFGGAVLLLSGALFFISKIDTDFSVGILIALFLAAAAAGIFRVAFSVPNEFPLDPYVGQKIFIEGIIYEEPDVRESYVNLKVKTGNLILSEGNKEIKSKALVRAPLFPEFSYGDKVKIVGTITKPQKFQNENGGEFDYPSYLAKDGIYYIIERGTAELISSGNGNFLKSLLFKIKGRFIETIDKAIPEPESSFLAGLVVGGKQSLGKEWLDRFQKAGVMHVVVLSGYNITIVAESVIKFFSLAFSSYLSMGLGALSIILFAIMTGGSATVIRASIMAIIVIIARATGRKYAVTRALIIAGVLMVLQNPAIVAFDPSFQLSFMATIALIYFSPVIEKRLKFIPERFKKTREIFISTISTQIFVLPLLLHMTGEFSLVGLAVNLLILGFIPATMLFGFLSGVTGFISSILSIPFAYTAYALLFYEMGVIKLFSELPFASVSLPALSGFGVVIIYTFFAGGLYWWHVRNLRFKNQNEKLKSARV
ncbi:MAG TPA: ComEC/Rec2 family competence protein [Candidatus Paceibacterota bacterium]